MSIATRVRVPGYRNERFHRRRRYRVLLLSRAAPLLVSRFRLYGGVMATSQCNSSVVLPIIYTCMKHESRRPIHTKQIHGAALLLLCCKRHVPVDCYKRLAVVVPARVRLIIVF